MPVHHDINWLAVTTGCVALILTAAVSMRLLFWKYPDDRFIQCAGSTMIVFAMMIAAVRVSIFPDWIITSITVLLGVLAFVSIGVGIQQIYAAIRRRRAR